MFQKIIKDCDKILFPESVIPELRKKYSLEEIKEIKQTFNLLFLLGILRNVPVKKYEYREAKKLASERRIPLGDCLNAIQARNHGRLEIMELYLFHKTNI